MLLFKKNRKTKTCALLSCLDVYFYSLANKVVVGTKWEH